jgi:hypothetical protein
LNRKLLAVNERQSCELNTEARCAFDMPCLHGLGDTAANGLARFRDNHSIHYDRLL